MSKMNQDFMTRVHDELNITIGVDAVVRGEIEAFNKAVHGDLWYEPYMKSMRAAKTVIKLENVTMRQACEMAESLRIAKPEAFVNVESPKPNGDFICNVTWNDQCTEFLEYDTYTEEGAEIIAEIKRQRELMPVNY
jgi:hypothetical protein